MTTLHNRYLTSWNRIDDPSTGDYHFKMDVDGLPEFFLWDKQAINYRSGPWNGLRFSGVPEMNATYNITFTLVLEKDEVSYSFGLKDKSLNSRVTMSSLGVLQRYTWIGSSQNSNLYWYSPKDQCDNYMECGVYGICDINASPICKCIRGFEPKDLQAWKMRNGFSGCVRTSELTCHGDGFWQLKNVKPPETSTVVFNRSMSLSECRQACLRNCSCTAYANSDIREGGCGCVMWRGVLDMRQFTAGEGGQDPYVRVFAPDLIRYVELVSLISSLPHFIEFRGINFLCLLDTTLYNIGIRLRKKCHLGSPFLRTPCHRIDNNYLLIRFNKR
ncbi:receptor-like serine/threonine-protein kinase SD1-8 [Diospyros lotus]|uniref:receptor-like serine/threonine-protein kinase SD1-8 n=1 Tax=Diospyros lotus TaxID=55363 RepID=UPI00225997B0|nr:receptor-like serine/threonine-protein kinase SD1-8 [Diospyros lotus]XP_052201123.1 receptor-like serine/threonine-protein kinase SD1-8 [Diospyros lotus]